MISFSFINTTTHGAALRGGRRRCGGGGGGAALANGRHGFGGGRWGGRWHWARSTHTVAIILARWLARSLGRARRQVVACVVIGVWARGLLHLGLLPSAAHAGTLNDTPPLPVPEKERKKKMMMMMIKKQHVMESYKHTTPQQTTNRKEGKKWSAPALCLCLSLSLLRTAPIDCFLLHSFMFLLSSLFFLFSFFFFLFFFFHSRVAQIWLLWSVCAWAWVVRWFFFFPSASQHRALDHPE